MRSKYRVRFAPPLRKQQLRLRRIRITTVEYEADEDDLPPDDRYSRNFVDRSMESRQYEPPVLHQSPKAGPFNPLPINCRGEVSVAYEFWESVYIPKNIAFAGFGTFCQVSRQDPMLFEQMVALSLVMQRLDKAALQRMTASILFHSNRSIMYLRHRLEDPRLEERFGDAVVATIANHALIQILCGDFESMGLHLQALRNIIAVRGGADKLGWGDYLKSRVGQAEAVWSIWDYRRRKALPDVVGTLIYPDHPFSPALCSQIATLPGGFRELALERHLSYQSIDVFKTILDRIQHEKPSPSSTAILSHMDDIRCRSDLTSLELALLVALLSCSVALVGAREIPPPTIDIIIQLHARSFPANHGLHDHDSSVKDAFDWAALVLYSITERGSTTYSWAYRWLTSGGESMPPESRCAVLGGKFLSVPD